MPHPAQTSPLTAGLLPHLAAARQRSDWTEIARHLDAVPRPVPQEWREAAREVAFALGQLKRFSEAITLQEEIWAMEPTARTASALAYLHYAAVLALPQLRRGGRQGQSGGERRSGQAASRAAEFDRESLREGFRRWIAEALRQSPGSVKDLYRLGIFEAQVESRHDKVALRAFTGAVHAYRALDPVERERRHDLHKYVMRALYAGARSALRLGQLNLARRLCFCCIREDRERNHVEPVHKLGLAGRICVATGELDAADRALRAALDAKGPPRRDHLHGLIAEGLFRRGDALGAITWIDRHVRPERRSAALWRMLGDFRAAAGALEEAEAAYRAALEQDRGGRHLTWTAIGALRERAGDANGAVHAYEKALEFRRRQYSSEHMPALAGLERAQRARGRGDVAAKIASRIAELEDRRHKPGLRKAASVPPDAAVGSDAPRRVSGGAA